MLNHKFLSLTIIWEIEQQLNNLIDLILHGTANYRFEFIFFYIDNRDNEIAFDVKNEFKIILFKELDF